MYINTRNSLRHATARPIPTRNHNEPPTAPNPNPNPHPNPNPNPPWKVIEVDPELRAQLLAGQGITSWPVLERGDWFENWEVSL